MCAYYKRKRTVRRTKRKYSGKRFKYARKTGGRSKRTRTMAVRRDQRVVYRNYSYNVTYYPDGVAPVITQNYFTLNGWIDDSMNTQYQQYKIVKVACHGVPGVKTCTYGDAVGGFYNSYYWVWKIDTQNWVPTYVTDMAHIRAYKRQTVQGFKMNMSPYCLESDLYDGPAGSAEYTTKRKAPWIDVSNGDVRHYGIGYCFDTANPYAGLWVEYKMTVAYRYPKAHA